MPVSGRRYRRQRAAGKMHPLAIVGICFGAAVLLALIVGNLLNLFVDGDLLDRLTGETSQPEEITPAPERAAPKIRAYPFVLGDKLSTLGAGGAETPAALAVPMNTPEGTLLYASAVSGFQGVEGSGKPVLSSNMEKLLDAVPYVCGVFYPQATKQETADLRYAAAASETALLREFVHAGASEILLCGLSFDAEHLNDTIVYLKQVRTALGESAHLGVSIPFAEVSAIESGGILRVIEENTSYVALDLRGLGSVTQDIGTGTDDPNDPGNTGASSDLLPETVFTKANYFLVGCRMRLLLSTSQAAYISVAEATISDFMIVTLP